MDWKAVFQSRTVWLNLVAGVLMILSAGEFIALIPKEALPYIALVTFVLNLVLRALGGEPLYRPRPKE